MAILRSVDGNFYEVPDDQLEKFLVPAEKVKEKLAAAGAPVPEEGAGAPPPGGSPSRPPMGPPTILVQIFGTGASGVGGPAAGPGGPPCPPGQAPEAAGQAGEVAPYGWRNGWRNGGWRNNWRNQWGNCWANNWQNWQNCSSGDS